MRTGPAWGAWLVQLVLTAAAFSASNLLATRLDGCASDAAGICREGRYDDVVAGFWRLELVLLVAVPLLLTLVPNQTWRRIHVRPLFVPFVAILLMTARLWQIAHALP